MSAPRGRAFGADLLEQLFESAAEPGYAAAAEWRRLRGPDPAWQRRLGRGGTAVVMLAFGVLLAVTYQHTVANQPAANRTRQRLIGEVKNQQAQTDRLQRRDDALRDEVARERDRALSSDSAGEAASNRLHDLETAAGMEKVSGPGMTVTLTDAPTPKDPVTGKASSENLGRVLDLDLQDVVNELWADGAEAVAVNNQRLGATSTIRTAGEAILVDFRPVASPYRVSAIGPPGMRGRFESSVTAARYRDFETEYQMGFEVGSVSRLTLPAAPDSSLRYAHAPSSPTPSPSSSGGGR
jgi:uncharacterized protein YlxW (UPF0749 family)